MGEQKHTPGPWRADKGLGCKRIMANKMGEHRQSQWMTEVASTPGLANEEEDAANAALIASAPALAARVEELLEDLDGMEKHADALAVKLASLEAAAKQMAAALEKIDADWDGEPEDMLDARAALAAYRETQKE